MELRGLGITTTMPRRLSQQRMTLSDLEWPFHGSSVPSVWDGNIIRIARYLCGS